MAAKKKQLDFTQDPPETLTDKPFYGLVLDDEQLAFANSIWNPNIDIVFCDSLAGTGKTTVAVGTANLLVQYGLYDNIVYVVSPYAEKRLGYLPGDLQSKTQYYYDPLYQAMTTCGINPNTSVNDDGIQGLSVGSKLGTEYITCIPEVYLRGVTIDNAVIILDETENYSVPQLKKTLTRIGKHTKVIVIGHTLQCDLENPEDSGFASFSKLFESEERCAVCELKTNHRSWISAHADTIDEFLKEAQRDHSI